MATSHPVLLKIDGTDYQVLKVDGHEQFSRPWSMDVEIVSRDKGVTLEKLRKDAAVLSLRAPVDEKSYRTAAFRGMVASVRQIEAAVDGTTYWSRYVVTLVANLWKLSLTRHTRIFMEKTIQEIVEEVLKDSGFSASHYEFKSSKGPKREFVVQYQETDLDFIHRWLEHEGIGYYFQETDDADRLIFFDATAGYVPVPGSNKVEYQHSKATHDDASAPGGEETWGQQYVFAFSTSLNAVQAKVLLKDYNWRKPSEEMKAEHDVVKDGLGFVYIYADHFKDTGEGKTLAKARAEEIKCRQKVCEGGGTHKSFRPGHTFKLEKYPTADVNGEYLLTAVKHAISQSVEGPWSAGHAGTRYRNGFTCIPSAETFRPERRTEWPSIHGFMHGKIDAGGSGQYAEIDDMGRYKVILPFDTSGKSGGKASRYVRMMQPYSGGGMGMHFPLHKGTEVVLGFVDGDPDRPIILGSIPNPETASPVTGSNQTQCKIHTGGGNSMTIEDTDGSQRILMHSPTEDTYVSLGAPPPK